MSTEDLLGELERERPTLLRLAEVVSLAVRVDAPLLRRARRTLVPEADAGVEANLWRSPLVQARGPEGFVFFQEAAEALRWRLARDGDGRSLTVAWELTKSMHQYLSPALLLEEEIAYLSVSSAPDATEQIEDLLRSAVAALVVGERRGLAHWAARAVPALPSAVRTLDTARMLNAAACLRLNGDARSLRSAGAFPAWLPWVVPADLPRKPITVRLFEGAVELDTRPNLEGQRLLLPQTVPLVMELSWYNESGDERQTVKVVLREGEVRKIMAPSQKVRLKTIQGEIYNLRQADTAAPRTGAKPVEELFLTLTDPKIETGLMESHDAEISRVLSAWSDGEFEALDRLVPLVFTELRAIASRQLRKERVGHTLQPTAIVNELYLRLVTQQKVQWRHRSEFYGVASRLIRRILVDHVRKRQAAKRGPAVSMASFEEALGVSIPEDSSILDLDEALEGLGRVDPRGAKVVELYAFGGLSFDEIAEALKIGRATALRDWKHAKLWLRRYLTR